MGKARAMAGKNMSAAFSPKRKFVCGNCKVKGAHHDLRRIMGKSFRKVSPRPDSSCERFFADESDIVRASRKGGLADAGSIAAALTPC